MNKKYIATVVFMAVSAFLLAQNSPDEKAILQVIQQETEDFTKMPFADVAQKYWILDEKTFICTIDPDGSCSILKMEQILSQTEIMPHEKTKVEKTEFKVFLSGNNATVYHHQLVKLEAEGIIIRSHEVRNMEKVGGEWKIHTSSGVKY